MLFTVQVDVHNMNKVETKNLRIEWADFVHSLDEVKPAFGVSGVIFQLNFIDWWSEDFKHCATNGICYYGKTFDNLMKEGKLFIEQVRSSEVTPLVSVLFQGANFFD